MDVLVLENQILFKNEQCKQEFELDWYMKKLNKISKLLSLFYKIINRIIYEMINIFKNVFLLIFFILIITPLSFIFKIIGFDPLKIKKGNKISYR